MRPTNRIHLNIHSFLLYSVSMATEMTFKCVATEMTFKCTSSGPSGYLDMRFRIWTGPLSLYNEQFLLSVEEMVNLVNLALSGDKKGLMTMINETCKNLNHYDNELLLAITQLTRTDCQCDKLLDFDVCFDRPLDRDYNIIPNRLPVEKEACKAARIFNRPLSPVLVQMCKTEIIIYRISYLKNIGLPITIENTAKIAYAIESDDLDIIRSVIKLALPSRKIIYESQVDVPPISDDIFRDLLVEPHESFIKCLIWIVASKVHRLMHEIKYYPRDQSQIIYSNIIADLQILHSLRSLPSNVFNHV